MESINWGINESYWLSKFIEHRYGKLNIYLCSVYGKRKKIRWSFGKKIFFSGENLEPVIEHNGLLHSNEYNMRQYLEAIQNRYSDYCIDECDVSLGYKDKDIKGYMRFPLWIMYIVPYWANIEDVKNIVSNINMTKSKAIREAVLINKHDCWGIRKKICDDLNGSLDITYAGKWRNSTNELWEQFNDDKLKYLNMFKFNICPENMDARDYCTEKIFDALRCGCIPIYAGCNDKPELDIINQDFIIKWNLDGDNTNNIKLINRLRTDDRFYCEWMKKKKLKPYAQEYIMERLQKLEERIGQLL